MQAHFYFDGECVYVYGDTTSLAVPAVGESVTIQVGTNTFFGRVVERNFTLGGARNIVHIHCKSVG